MIRRVTDHGPLLTDSPKLALESKKGQVTLVVPADKRRPVVGRELLNRVSPPPVYVID